MQEQRIRERAFALWEAAGRPNGQDMEHWLAAEQQVKDETVAAPVPAAKPAPRKRKAASTAAKKTTTKTKAPTARKTTTRAKTTKKSV